jgi:phosphotransferase system HPr (HPr) family protein
VVPTSSETLVRLPAGIDLHARPAAQVVRIAAGYDATIMVGLNGREADAKSLLAVMALGATGGTELRVSASGDDAVVALGAMCAYLATLE